ncbi:MAG: hypothetical protein U9N72_08100 [Bacteroidota bacterium]|nr:hypothetical protein [Bacteroidota bacterium]
MEQRRDYIAYDNTECGSAIWPPPENCCGILITDNEGIEKEFIIERRRFPYWGPGNDTIYYGLFYYDLVNKTEHIIVNTDSINFWVNGRPQYHPTKDKIFFRGKFTETPVYFKLHSVEPTGKNFKLVSKDPISDFSLTPDGKILYVLWKGEKIDRKQCTIWIMDDDGKNKKQLTFNDY